MFSSGKAKLLALFFAAMNFAFSSQGRPGSDSRLFLPCSKRDEPDAKFYFRDATTPFNNVTAQ